MENSILESSKELKNKRFLVYRILILILVTASFVLEFFPNITYLLDNNVYNVSLFQIIKDKGLYFNDGVVLFTLTIKICAVITVLLQVLALFAFLKNKFKLASISFVLSPIGLVGVGAFSANIMDTQLERFSIKFLIPIILIFVFSLINAVLTSVIYSKEKLSEIIFFLASCVSIGFLILITIYMLVSGLPAITEIGFFNFIFGKEWEPSQNLYGILPLALSSIFGTLGAIVLGVPVGLLTAIFLSEIASNKLSGFLRQLIQLLAGIPSVVYGFFGMLCITPLIRKIFGENTVGDSLLAVIIILSIMILPTIISISETSLKAVPSSYKEASLALGATPIETIFKITLPAAKSGILSAVILGVGRAIGETMAVIMVAGNVVNMPSILSSVRLLTTGIVLEMSYSSGLHRQALFAIGLILFIFIMIVNISISFILRRGGFGARK